MGTITVVIKKIVWAIFLIAILAPIYNLIHMAISNIANLDEARFWFFSVIAQFNGAVIGLVLAALGISFIMHSEKTIFIFKEGDFDLLKYTIYIFILNTLFAFMGLSVIYQPNISIVLISLSLIIEIFALIFLGLFFTKSIDIFQNEVQYELKKKDSEKIIKDISIELSSDEGNCLVFQNRGTPISDVEGTIHPRICKKIEPGPFSPSTTILNFPAIEIKVINKINDNSSVRLSHIDKDISNQMNIGDNLDFNICLKFRKQNDFLYIVIQTTLEKMWGSNLKFIKEPFFEIVSEELYNGIVENVFHNPYPCTFNFSR